MNWSIFELDEEVGLHQNLLFWLAVGVPIALSILLSLPIMIREGVSFCFTSTCYKTFVELFSFPIYLSSLSLLLGVMVGRFHGSKQRGMALSEAKKNNSFKSYFDHRQSFLSHLSTYDWILLKKRGLALAHPYKLYQVFFPYNSPDYVETQCRESHFWREIGRAVDSVKESKESCIDIYGFDALFESIGCKRTEGTFRITAGNKEKQPEDWFWPVDMSIALEVFAEIVTHASVFGEVDEPISIDDLLGAMASIMGESTPSYVPSREF